VRIGNFKPGKNARILDAKGLVLAPVSSTFTIIRPTACKPDPLAETQSRRASFTGSRRGWRFTLAHLPWLDALRKNPAAVTSPPW